MVKIKTKKFATSPKGKAACEAFLDFIGNRVIDDVYTSDNKITVRYYG